MTILEAIVVAIVAFNVALICWLVYIYRVETRPTTPVCEISPDAGGLL